MPSKKDRPRRDWLRIALDNIGDAVFALSPAGCVTFLNAAAERLTGIDPEVARQRPLTELIELRDEADRPFPLSDTGALPGTIRRRLRLTAADGSGKTVEATLEPVLATRPGSHDGASAVLVLDDLTARAQLEEELSRRAEELVAADRRKDQFLAMLAHELRNPLAPIRNAVELMRQVETFDPSFQPSREMVERQVKHLARLVDDLLDVSRITQGSIRLRKEPVSLGPVVERAVEATRPLIDSRGHELTVSLPASPIRLDADPARVEQVIANLLNNAAKYTMPGGHIWVSAGTEGNDAVVRVRDNGIGVPPYVLGRVFEPFVQSDGSLARTEGGLGIGLTLVRSLVDMHGGSVEAHSPGLGQGSEFVIRLPMRVAAATAEPAAPHEARPFAPARPVRVLVVEDNVDAAESLATLLRIWGHEVRVVHDGREALDAAQDYQPEVVLLDIGLPGLDGYQVAERLHDEVHLDDALLVAMTGYGQPEDRRRSRAAGIHHHFVKPVEPFVLRNLLAEVAAPAAS